MERKSGIGEIIISALFIVFLLFYVVDSKVTKEVNAENEDIKDSFVIISNSQIGSNIQQTIMYDPETNVMYTFISRGGSGGISVMYDANGTPLTYSASPEKN